MTKQELLGLKHHDRVRYIGTRPLSEVFTHENYYDKTQQVSNIPKTVATSKGVILASSPYDEKGTITMYLYNSHVQKVDPAEWELLERRQWVEPELEYKRAKAYIPNLIEDFQKKLKWFLEDYQGRVDRKLEGIPLDKKMKVIMELSPEDKVWFGVITSAPDEAMKTLKESFNQDAT